MQCVDCKDLYIHYPISAMHTSFGRRLIPSKYTYPFCEYNFTPSQSINKEKRTLSNLIYIEFCNRNQLRWS